MSIAANLNVFAREIEITAGPWPSLETKMRINGLRIAADHIRNLDRLLAEADRQNEALAAEFRKAKEVGNG